jgi:hypothetical protein
MANDKELKLESRSNRIIHALLIDLDSYGEIERITDEVRKFDLFLNPPKWRVFSFKILNLNGALKIKSI